ncbi:cobalamin-binding protein [Saccharophagus sp. K07]|jgi:iron complex transport system substrate-binding protein|uniref:cobalamin-binding protein n=1 Tax=Saccharophagus sp. K07 TaxID=2283636 RepID=UPI001652694A|nr:cobalamin-binding protein [Saccharophagus sp. K07]MBC6906549.1 cobalamin-binding protein [Saccharophagus sp. K07]
MVIVRTIAAALLLALAVISHAEVSVTDYLGRQVTLAKPAQRVIALAPHIVENLYSAGAGETLVGAVEYCDYPPEAKKIPRVGAISAYSLEAIVAAKPDLIVLWHSGLGARSLAKFLELGLTVYADDPKTLDDIPRSIRDFGVLTGRHEHAESVAAEFERRQQQLRTTYGGQTTLSVLYQVWHQPLQTVNGDHVISDLIRLCGGVNAFADAATIAPKISIESVIARNPDVILASGIAEERPAWLDDWNKYPHLAAVKNHHIYSVPPDLIQRHTPRILEGAHRVCELLAGARQMAPKTSL